LVQPVEKAPELRARGDEMGASPGAVDPERTAPGLFRARADFNGEASHVQ
jgi:hypothetical protein